MIVPRTSIGIEIAGQDLRVAVVREFARKRRLIRLDTLDGFLDLPVEERKRTLAAYIKRNRIPISRAYLTLPSTSGSVRDIEFPAEVGSNLRSALALQIENLSPWGVDEVYWDYAYEPLKKGARVIVAHVAIIPKIALDPWIALFRSAGLPLTGASLSSLSWAHGASALWVADRQPTMIFGVERDYVEGTLAAGGRLHAIHLAGSETSELIKSSVSRLSRGGRLDPEQSVRIIVHGAMSERSGVEPIPMPIGGGTTTAQGFGAIASALLGIAATAFASNLVPVGQRRRRNYLQLAPTYVLVFLLVALGVMYWLREPYQQFVYAARLDREVRRMAPVARSVTEQEQQLNRLSARLKTLDGTLHDRDANLEALRELARILPGATWLNSYQYQEGAITISGYSSSASALQRIIEASPVFRDAQFVSSITRDASGKDRFTIRATIEGAR